jgi:rRNA-processing protein FCF1
MYEVKKDLILKIKDQSIINNLQYPIKFLIPNSVCEELNYIASKSPKKNKIVLFINKILKLHKEIFYEENHDKIDNKTNNTNNSKNNINSNSDKNKNYADYKIIKIIKKLKKEINSNNFNKSNKNNIENETKIYLASGDRELIKAIKKLNIKYLSYNAENSKIIVS